MHKVLTFVTAFVIIFMSNILINTKLLILYSDLNLD